MRYKRYSAAGTARGVISVTVLLAWRSRVRGRKQAPRCELEPCGEVLPQHKHIQFWSHPLLAIHNVSRLEAVFLPLALGLFLFWAGAAGNAPLP